MLINKKPYFMINKEWFYYNVKEFKYMLTDKATKEAKESYDKYYKELDEGLIIDIDN